ncbi:FAD binding domain-containing protein [Actinomadura kijaniata]|uniref:FAD binding domain-containing protein n=1 Tax=Actinomadura kijaniata TaxID=46161 RepID=UPI003F192DE4
MEFVRVARWAQALEVRAACPRAVPVSGGTDVMVQVNAGRSRPAMLLDLGPVAELAGWEPADGWLRVGAGVTYTRLVEELGDRLPGLAQAARTVGSRQIRNRGTVGGNLGTAATKGVCHPVLLACDARVELAEATGGTRLIEADDFYQGERRTALAPTELIRAVWLRPARGPQYFAKVGVRNAMTTAICSLALTVDHDRRRVGVGIGAAGPVPSRARAAEEFAAAHLDWKGDPGRPLEAAVVRHFAELVARAADPADDLRAGAAYRRHALTVLARRTLTWATTPSTTRPADHLRRPGDQP